MKKIVETILRNYGPIFGLLGLFIFATVGAASAGTITKTFEFGAGTQYSHSNVRTFYVPCNLKVVATIKYKRGGSEGASNDFPIKIDLRQADIGADEEGPIAQTVSATARRNEQTATLLAPDGSPRGCSLPWRVRVRYANAGTAPAPVTGSIRVDFDDVLKTFKYSHYPWKIIERKSNHTILLTHQGFEQGRLEIILTWNHSLGGPVPGPLPVKLKAELLDPNGRVLATDMGYSNHEINPCCSGDKMKIVFQVPDCESDSKTWNIRITNDTNDDVNLTEVKFSHKPSCPN